MQFTIEEDKINFTVNKEGKQFSGSDNINNVSKTLRIFTEDISEFIEQCEKQKLINIDIDNEEYCTVSFTNVIYNKKYEIKLQIVDMTQCKLLTLQNENKELKNLVNTLGLEIKELKYYVSENYLCMNDKLLIVCDEKVMTDLLTVLNNYDSFNHWKQSELLACLIRWFVLLFGGINTSWCDPLTNLHDVFDPLKDMKFRHNKLHHSEYVELYINNKQKFSLLPKRTLSEHLKPLFKKIFLIYMDKFNNILDLYPYSNFEEIDGRRLPGKIKLLNLCVPNKDSIYTDNIVSSYILEILEDSKEKYEYLNINNTNDSKYCYFNCIDVDRHIMQITKKEISPVWDQHLSYFQRCKSVITNNCKIVYNSDL